MFIHSGEKPHAYAVCGKTYTLAKHLLTHMRIHTREKSYLCDICNKTYAH